MRIEFTAEVELDRAGYEVQQMPGRAACTLAMPAVEPHSAIVAKSGIYESRTYTAGRGAAAWKSITKINSVEQIIAFFGKFGPLLLPSGRNPDGKNFWHLGHVTEAIEFLKYIASRKENLISKSDNDGIKDLKNYLSEGMMFSHATGHLDKIGIEGIMKINIKLYQHFILTEMLMEMGVKRRNVEVLKNCEHCGMQFTAGGGRGGKVGLGLRKLDARYCSPACAKAASYQRRKAATCTEA